MSDTVTLEKEEGVGIITLRRPERRNALDLPTARALAACIEQAGDDLDIRAVLLTGEGGAFCSGADLKAELGASPGETPTSPFETRMDAFHAVIRALTAIPQPVVAFVDGAAVGFGCSLALAADFVVASDASYFQISFVHLGLVSDGGATWILPRLVGTARAMELLMTGDRISAERAREWGLIAQVAAPDIAPIVARGLARRLERGPSRAYAQLRRLVREGWGRPLAAQLDAEADAQLEAVQGPELAEGIQAWVERRAPDFRKVPR